MRLISLQIDPEIRNIYKISFLLQVCTKCKLRSQEPVPLAQKAVKKTVVKYNIFHIQKCIGLVEQGQNHAVKRDYLFKGDGQHTEDFISTLPAVQHGYNFIYLFKLRKVPFPLLPQLLAFNRPLYGIFKNTKVINRFVQEIISARLKGCYNIIICAMTCKNNLGYIGIIIGHGTEKFPPAKPGHLEVCKDKIILPRPKHLKSPLPVLCSLNVITESGDISFQDFSDKGIIINNKYTLG